MKKLHQILIHSQKDIHGTHQPTLVDESQFDAKDDSMGQFDELLDYAIESLDLDPDEVIKRMEWHKKHKAKYPHIYS